MEVLVSSEESDLDLYGDDEEAEVAVAATSASAGAGAGAGAGAFAGAVVGSEGEEEEAVGVLSGIGDPDSLIFDGIAHWSASEKVALLRGMSGKSVVNGSVGHLANDFVSHMQLRCLLDGRWLKDEVLNFNLSLLRLWTACTAAPSRVEVLTGPGVQAAKTAAWNPPEGKVPLRAWVANTFFFTKLFEGSVYMYKNVRRWTEKSCVDITQLQAVIVPVNTSNVHWHTIFIDLENKEIRSYDSMASPGAHMEEMQVCARWVSDETANKEGESQRWDTSDWKLTSMAHDDIPQQYNSCDCGVFMFSFCKHLLFGGKDRMLECFQQSNMPRIRREMALAIVQRPPAT